jgi:nitrous oxidase accessory protein NosD
MNALSLNEIGLNIYSSSGNDIHHNAFIDNSIQATSPLGNVWDDGQGEGNYWDDYTGSDNGAGGRIAGDGIGDVGLPHLGFDSYPLMKNPLDLHYK